MPRAAYICDWRRSNSTVDLEGLDPSPTVEMLLLSLLGFRACIWFSGGVGEHVAPKVEIAPKSFSYYFSNKNLKLRLIVYIFMNMGSIDFFHFDK